MESVLSLHLSMLIPAAIAGLAIGLAMLTVHLIFDALARIYKEVFK